MDAEKSYESRKKARREAKKKIIEAAADLIHESGYHTITLDQIAERLHISKVSIYHHWTSKQELMFDLMRIGYKAFIERLGAIVKDNDTPDSKLRRVIEEHVTQAVVSKISTMMNEQQWHLASRHRKELIKLRDTYDQMFCQIIIDGINQGLFRKIDAKLLYYTIMGAVNYAWIWYSPEGRMSVKDIASNMSGFILDGIRANATGKKR